MSDATPDAPAVDPIGALAPCDSCGKPRAVCVCDRLALHRTKRAVVILQHPQEVDVVLGTARLAPLCLQGARVIPGLSWASLSHALEREVDPKRWAVLWSGSLKQPLDEAQLAQRCVALDRAGAPLDAPAKNLEGIVLLDGTWSQAKTLWWRNPWLLKHARIVLHPREPSVYGRLRKEPHRGALSTLEAAVEALDALGEAPAVRADVLRALRTMCQRARDHEALLRPLESARARAQGEGGEGAAKAGAGAGAGAKKPRGAAGPGAGRAPRGVSRGGQKR